MTNSRRTSRSPV